MGKISTAMKFVFLCSLLLGAVGVVSASPTSTGSLADGGLADGSGGNEDSGDVSTGCPQPVMGWLARTSGGPSLGAQALKSLMERLAILDVEWIDPPSLLLKLRQRDEREGILSQARLHLEKGRKLHLGLNLDKAESEYRKSVELIQQGFALYYEPMLLAEPLLQLGVAQYQAGDKVLARNTFMRVAALEPDLKLAEGYYSPSIRKAYSEAVSGLGVREPTIPAPGELRRICNALDIRGLVVASSERLGGRSVLRLGVFDRSYGSFVAVETMALVEGEMEKQQSRLVNRLGDVIARMLGLRQDEVDAGQQQYGLDESTSSEESSIDGGIPDGNGSDAGVSYDIALEFGDGPLPGMDPGPENRSWTVKYWWVWPVAAVVVTSVAVALPLTVFRQDVVDVKVRY